MNKQHLFLAPLLVIYIIIIILFNNPLKGDEYRYVAYAENITEGFYTDVNNPDLSNGPGYPLVLTPFVAFNIDLFTAKILNGIFVFVGVLFFFHTLRYYTKLKYALIIALAIGLYPPLLKWLPLLYTEAFAFMLINGFIFYFCSSYQKEKKNWKSCVLTALFLGFLVLTKVIFFNVLLVSIVLLAILVVVKKKWNLNWSLYVLIGAILFITPYLIYSYSVTDKLFYLGTRGGEILYHRSTPFEGEYGNWISSTKILGIENQNQSKNSHELSHLRDNHQEFYLQLQPLSNIERDSAFKSKAFENMKNHPLKYSKNTIANIGRLLFNYPNSHRSQSMSAYGYILPNGLLIVLLIFTVYPMFLARKKIPVEIISIFLFSLIYGFGMILLHGKPRYFIMMVPSIVLSITYIFSNVLKINIVNSKQQA